MLRIEDLEAEEQSLIHKLKLIQLLKAQYLGGKGYSTLTGSMEIIHTRKKVQPNFRGLHLGSPNGRSGEKEGIANGLTMEVMKYMGSYKEPLSGVEIATALQPKYDHLPARFLRKKIYSTLRNKINQECVGKRGTKYVLLKRGQEEYESLTS